MKETAERLLTHTRRELEEMAEKLGINTAGISKKMIAESILEARNKACVKETPKVAAPVKRPRIGKKGVFAKRAAIDEQIKENEEAVAKIDTGVKEVQRGIRDMRSAMDKKAMEMQRGVAEIHRGVRDIKKSIGAQIKENEKAAVKIGTGAKELQNRIKEFETEIKVFQDGTAEYIRDFYYG